MKPMETVNEMDGKRYVHYKSWQETHTGLVDANYLETKMTLERCIAIARKWTDNTPFRGNDHGNRGNILTTENPQAIINDVIEIRQAYTCPTQKSTKIGIIYQKFLHKHIVCA